MSKKAEVSPTQLADRLLEDMISEQVASLDGWDVASEILVEALNKGAFSTDAELEAAVSQVLEALGLFLGLSDALLERVRNLRAMVSRLDPPF